ncbi:MAG: hypothetical protein QF406_09720 [Verrucomicrobiota bacterium]|nr:hypothetical protein [Verrucomicrobiota bacterium]
MRYLLHAHNGAVDPAIANRIAEIFNPSSSFEVSESKRKHRQFEVQRTK